jgi:hypothetical protein
MTTTWTHPMTPPRDEERRTLALELALRALPEGASSKTITRYAERFEHYIRKGEIQ